MDSASCEGYAVHVYPDAARDRMFIVGRLSDGRSFAMVDAGWRPRLLVAASDADRAIAAVRPVAEVAAGRFGPCELAALDGGPLAAWTCPGYGVYRRSVEALERAGVPAHGAGASLGDLYRADRAMKGGLRLRGEPRKGRRVDLVFDTPDFEPFGAAAAPLVLLSLDIETDEGDRSVRAVSALVADWDPAAVRLSARGEPVVLFRGSVEGDPRVRSFPGERAVLAAFRDLVVEADPDVLTGWNVVDFDLARLSERFEAAGLPFDLGRTPEPARLLPGGRGRTGTAVVPGRQVLDAMRAARAGPERFEDYSLETVSSAVLGRGKTVSLRGARKLAELDRMYRDDPAAFCDYAAADAGLVVDVLDATGLFGLTLARAALVGLGVDRAWTSVAAFERAYGAELRSRGVAPPPPEADRDVSGAAGGTVLPPAAGLHDSVMVLDFRSLYPSVMSTFNVDPMAHARSGLPDDVVAPNGARFSRVRGPLPELVDDYLARRRDAAARGDAIASHVYKILMNSFYGVLGSAGCRYARTELAGAITSFGRAVLLRARATLEADGYRVLYGDTDSLFVASSLDPSSAYAEFRDLGERLCGRVNEDLRGYVEDEYGLESRLELRFDKAYARFVIPPLRFTEEGEEARGRAKGYAGLLRGPDGDAVDVKGMEAVRSDWTPLARRFQLLLLELAFGGASGDELGACVRGTLASLQAGELDGELVYTRVLRRPASSYVKNSPPQVKAARLAGLSGRGAVSYVMTADGPAPVDPGAPPGSEHPTPDYRFYEERQLLPIARSLAAAGMPIPLEAFERKPMQPELFADGR